MSVIDGSSFLYSEKKIDFSNIITDSFVQSGRLIFLNSTTLNLLATSSYY